MTTAQFVAGACLFALLIVDIYCRPYQKGADPNAYGSTYGNVAPNFDSYKGAASGQFSQGAVSPNNAPPQGASTIQRGPAPSAGSSSSSGPAFSGYGGTPMSNNPASSAQPGSHDVNWALAPPRPLSGGHEMSGAPGASSQGYVSPPRPPPGPDYQAGELSRFEVNFEHGISERETEEQGSFPPPPPPPYMKESAGPAITGPAFTSQPQPGINIGGGWGPYPYPYDYRFLTGQYPPGTVTHASSTFEQGIDHWQDSHYVRDYSPNNPGPGENTNTNPADSAGPQSFKGPGTPVAMAHYGQGGAHAGQPVPSYGGYRQPGGGHNLGKGA